MFTKVCTTYTFKEIKASLAIDITTKCYVKNPMTLDDPKVKKAGASNNLFGPGGLFLEEESE